MHKSRWILVLLFPCLLGLFACQRGIRTDPLTYTEDLVDLDPKLGLHTTEAVGDQQYVVILADFPDVQRQLSEEVINNRMIEFLGTYFYEASYHKLNLTGTLTKRYMLPHPVDYYKISPRNLEVDPDLVLALVTDAINAADDDVEFSPDLYVAISLGATQNEYGMIGYSAVPGMLGFTTSEPITTKSGEVVERAVVFCENAHPGTYIHDFLHSLGAEQVTASYDLRLSDQISVGLFYDAGNVWRDPWDIDPTKLYRGAGLGVQLVTPFGPIGLDYAYGFDKPDPGWQLHFRMGVGY